jgi:carbamoyl-phosphate synthase large subunit
VPRRDDIESVLVIGSGPIVIGQACEFDYSGTQACRVLREEGYRVVLANSNPATIMTDPQTADSTYVEPLDPEVLEAIIAKERPDALLPTLGGQTALNLTMALLDRGALDGVEVIGARPEAIRTAEDRNLFRRAMTEIGLEVPKSGFAHSLDEALAIADEVGYPVMVRPSFILGGKGTGIAERPDQLVGLASDGLDASPIGEILVERSVAGWKEYELEVMRDGADNCVVVCSIENVDPMGIHTGDSITVAPAQTLTDVEYQAMRDDSFACLRRVGVETGGSNVQFAVDPLTGRRLIIEMNPRVSRSSALASKATGFPIAKIAARLAVGYTLDEIRNDITRATPASFEPTIDYVVTKIPRWAFEKLPGTEGRLGTRMQSVGEVMAIGRTFCESLQKAVRSLEQGRAGLNADPQEEGLDALADGELLSRLAVATPERIFEVECALRRGLGVEAVAAATGIDPWFLRQIARIGEARCEVLAAGALDAIDRTAWRRFKQLGFSDAQLAYLLGCAEPAVRAARVGAGVVATYKTVDTCGGEFEAFTPYHYATYEDEDEVRPSGRDRVIILGSGPNRIGQGIEFDYCCVHASIALRAAGYETVMVNCNPETVSTDYDTSDRLYFEPLTAEDVANVVDAESRLGGRLAGVVVALGGQTPLKLAHSLPPELVLGTSPASIDRAEDRRHWNALCEELGIPQPPGGTAITVDDALTVARRIGYPVLVRPSYVLGGRAMEIVFDDAELRRVMAGLRLEREGGVTAERPVLVDRFLEDAVEIDVDAIRDKTGEVLVCGVMEHVEEAGVHSGDSACALPPQTLSNEVLAAVDRHTRALADALGVEGLLNVQYAVKDGEVHVLEANPRASRTVPFVAKATGVPVAMLAARVMVGETLAALREEGLFDAWGSLPSPGHVSVKEAVLPFDRFPGVDTLLGPEMRSTGEVMGVDTTFGLAFAKSQTAAGTRLPDAGTVFLSLADRDKPGGLGVARGLSGLGFLIAATLGTAGYLRDHGLAVDTLVAKVGEEGMAADAVQLIAGGKVQMVVNTPRGRGSRDDGVHIRAAALAHHVPCITTLAAAHAAVAGMADRAVHPLAVRTLQELHGAANGR